MECVAAFLMLLFVLLAMGAYGALTGSQSSRLEAAFRQLAQRYGGTFISGGWFGRPTVHFHYGQARTPVVVYTNHRQRKKYTHIAIDWPDARLHCEVLSRWAYLPNQIQFRDLQEVVVDAEFERTYVVLANDVSEARNLLIEPVRWQLLRLRGMLGDDFLHVSINRGEMQVIKQRIVTQPAALEDLVRSVGELFDQAMLTRSTGIEFLGNEQLQVISEATCQVCGESIITDMVFCRRCKTPHHLECWQYVGTCTTYGCQEKRFITPYVAEKSDPSARDATGDGEARTA